jgi:hypothetical protein
MSPINSSPPVPPATALADLWRLAGLDSAALAFADLAGTEPALPSSFAVSTAAQVSMAAAALAAGEVWHARTGSRQRVGLDMRAAALDCFSCYTLDGKTPDLWDKLSGLYSCGADIGPPGYVRIHANFAHHRDRALHVLGLPQGDGTERPAVEVALRRWRADDFEAQVAAGGGVVAALRTFAEWDRSPEGQAVAGLPAVVLERIGDAPPRPLPPFAGARRPLTGLKVLELTRILAGPIAGRALAAHGADVMLVNAPHLPNIAAIADTSRGKLSAHIDLATETGRATLAALVREVHIFMQGYRPGGIASKGFSPTDLARLAPGIVTVSLSAYGHTGPRAGWRGFDSLVQTATGFNHAEAEALGSATPKTLPMQILDYASGYLMAFGALAALLRQSREGGSWHVRVALAGTGRWLRSLGRVSDPTLAAKPDPERFLAPAPCGFGALMALPHPVTMSETPPRWERPSMPPGSHPPVWPAAY